ncbi:hypothetical protein CHS0354_037002 [Potamilus streckersoni]|uniref:Uncharacterized protein n=1 Tax=Potamilus streckersoni TaxID=2493646 RepID=A0AAE0SKN6_9BIVA|nr:hypothetical protein CHS0354_037002 [Potamilus streckersoni]
MSINPKLVRLINYRHYYIHYSHHDKIRINSTISMIIDDYIHYIIITDTNPISTRLYPLSPRQDSYQLDYIHDYRLYHYIFITATNPISTRLYPLLSLRQIPYRHDYIRYSYHDKTRINSTISMFIDYINYIIITDTNPISTRLYPLLSPRQDSYQLDYIHNYQLYPLHYYHRHKSHIDTTISIILTTTRLISTRLYT